MNIHKEIPPEQIRQKCIEIANNPLTKKVTSIPKGQYNVYEVSLPSGLHWIWLEYVEDRVDFYITYERVPPNERHKLLFSFEQDGRDVYRKEGNQDWTRHLMAL